jgi:glycosyltransferase involved in cell wall biosynthesis
MKKLLHLGCNAGSESMPKYFKEQCDYKEFLLDGNLANNLENLDYVPDIVFMQVQSDTIDGKNTCSYIGRQIKEIRDKGAFVINWTGDKRNGVPRWMIDFSDNVSITGFSNEEDMQECHKRGIKSVFLQQGIDTNIFNPVGVAVDTPDIVFLANNYGNEFPLSRYRKEAVNALKSRFGNRFKVYGNGWGHNSGNVNSSQYEEAKVYRGAKIAISISHFNSDRYFSDRLGRALCTGVFVLSHDYSGLDKDFIRGEHLETFGSINEMVNKCEEFIGSEKRGHIARKGQELASKEFSYQNIVTQILNLNE